MALARLTLNHVRRKPALEDLQVAAANEPMESAPADLVGNVRGGPEMVPAKGILATDACFGRLASEARSEAAIDTPIGAGDKRGLIGKQEDDTTGNLCRPGDPPRKG